MIERGKYKRTVEIRKKQSISHRGQIPWNKGVRTNIEPANKNGKFQLCSVCNKRFWTPKCRFEIAKYCSNVCKSLNLKGKHFAIKSEFSEGAIPWNKDKTNVYSVEVRRKMGESHKGLKQSKEAILKRIKSGKEHYNWQGGISFEPYSPDFNRTLKEIIKKRDNYTCQLCGEHIPKFISQAKRLVVHHIDYDKKNSLIENLITLCHFCNISVNTKKSEWMTFFQEKILKGGAVKGGVIASL